MKNTFLAKLLERIDHVGADELQNYLQQVAREKGFLEVIFNTLQEGILVINVDGKILYFNPSLQRLIGLPDNALGQTVGAYLKELDWKKILQERRVVSRDLEVFYPDPRFLNFYLVPLEQGAEFIGYALIFHDITATRAQTRDEIESEKVNALTLLAAGVAHELGNPLNSLHIHLQLLERDLKKMEGSRGERLVESVHVAQGEIARLDNIINQFLRAVRPGHPERKPAQINEIVRESLDFLKPEIQDRDILVEMELAKDLPLVPLDAGQMKQAIYNLVKNSIQAMQVGGGILRVHTERNDTHLLISFADNGCGISPENVSRIFEPYFTTKDNGSGLGLFIIRRIVREHGGDLILESDPGRGTTARIVLPLAERRVRLLSAGDSEAANS